MRNKLVQKMCAAALLTAIAYIITAFLIIPYSAGGYFNFGDVFIYIGAALLGPWWGAFIGIVAGSMADLTAGYAEVVAFTILAKGLMALAAGYLYRVLPKYFKVGGFLIGGILMSFVYLANYFLIYETPVAAWTSFGFDILQITVASVIAYVIMLSFGKIFYKYFTKDEEKVKQ